MNFARTLLILPLVSVLLFASSIARPTHETGAARGATISGYIRDAENGETLVGATVLLKGTSTGGTSNKNGFYSIANIPPGKYTVIVSYVGYTTQEIPTEIKEGESKQLSVSLKQQVIEFGAVTVEGDRTEDTREITVSKINIPTRQLTNIRLGGEADIFRSIQYLPGVLASSQISSGLYIRGGSPDQTLVLVDGSTVYNPSHLFGFFSTFNPDAVKDVELIKGGYPAEYGGRLSAVLDVVQKDGNRNQMQGTLSLGLISTRLSLQGPLGNGSFFIGGRRSYIDFLTSMIETEEDPLPDYFFYDVNGKVAQDFGDNDKVFVSGFTGEDQLSVDNNAGFNGKLGISNRAVSGRWTHVFSDNVFTTFNGSWSRYRNSFIASSGGFDFEIENVIQDFTGKLNMEWFAGSDLTVKWGAELNRYIFNYKQNWTGKTDSAIAEGTNEVGRTNLEVVDYLGAGYAQANYQLTPLLSLQAGVRANYFDMRKLVKIDPRIALRYQMDADIAVKAAFGVYHQYFRLASLPDFSFADTWLPTDSTVNPSKAIHYVLGVETHPFEGFDLNVDLYYKNLSNISEMNQYATVVKNTKDVFYNGEGEAYGFELFLQKKAGRFTGWAGYALGFTKAKFREINKGNWFRPKWDRRHDFKIVGQYKLNDHWDVSATFTFQSGQSYTGATSRIGSMLPGENMSNSIILPAEWYGLRLPPSHQLNLSANYHSTLFGLPMRLLIDIYNVYSRRDIWFRYYDAFGDVVKVTDVELLPIIPTVALELDF